MDWKTGLGVSLDAAEAQFAKTSHLSRGSNNFATSDASKTTVVFLTLFPSLESISVVLGTLCK